MMKISLTISTIFIAIILQWSLSTPFFDQRQAVVTVGKIEVKQ